MKNSINQILFFLLLSLPLFGQTYAGEEKVACSETGAVIGVDNPNPDWCYIWEITEGLNPADKNSTNPLVTPNLTTTYRCTVTDQNFSFKGIDEVKVKIAFGGIQFSPRYIEPNGEMNQAQAILTSNEALDGGPGGSYTWSIGNDPENTGCSIDPNSGWISGCSNGGSVEIIATRDDAPSCKAKKEIEVNIGVKDLIVRDVSNAGREAHAGDTLYMVSSGPIEFEAVPNEGSTFPPGQPSWSGDLTATNDIVWSTSMPIFGSYNVTAGDKTVTVRWLEIPDVNLGAAVKLDLFNKIQEKFQKNGPALVSQFCTPIPLGINFPSSISGSLKISTVPAYKDPDLGEKIQVTVAVPGLSAGGCAPLMPCCGFLVRVLGADVIVFSYLRAIGGLNFDIDATRDPSTANGTQWIGTANLTGFIEFGAGLAADASLGPYGVAGGGDAFIKVEGIAQLRDAEVRGKAKWNGLQFQAGGLLYKGNPGNPEASLGISLGPYNIIEGGETQWYQLIDLTQ